MTTPKPEFDQYASNYKGLLSEPIRNIFASDPTFYSHRKWLLIQDFFRRRNQSLSGLSWLDVGCGEGELLRNGIHTFGRLAGCDPSQGMLSAIEDLDVRPQPDPEKLPFEDATFDFATAVCVFHHVEPNSRQALLAEMRRILAPGGIACLIEHNAYNPVVRGMVRRIAVDANAILLKPSETRSRFREAGFQPIATELILYLPSSFFKLVGDAESLFRHLPLGGQYASFTQNQQERSSVN